MRGELDWIVMKCLEKDRTRRYETANALAADVRRYLDRRAGGGRPAVGLVPAAEVRAAEPGGAGDGGGGGDGPGGRHGGEHLAGDPGDEAEGLAQTAEATAVRSR